MNADSRLNILLTHGQSAAPPAATCDREHQPWYRSLSTLLAPLGVRTFEATTGPQAMAVIEKNPIHLAVVDTRLTGTDELSLPKLIQKLKEPCQPPQDEKKRVFRVEVILLTPARNDKMLAEALKFNVFSVVSEPVDVNLMLEMMARAMKRFHQNKWPV